ncbi:hypothetical protein BOX15_Mlig023906g1 [Macrostomum lignano]|uniref:Oxysterol-binding protein n=1 Tax=Macrostomum lignano TaxID=282301 RepID=A0A267G2U8_9PLAT|nr:hypothetical protein BOX15_Mlig023906g1 [Macrostomum lignano]
MMEYGSILMEGPLSKWTNVMNGWQFRWFVLDRSTALLTYYTSRDKMVRGERRGCVKLRGALIGIDDEDDSTFTITTQDRKVFHFQARDADQRQRWLDALEETLNLHFDHHLPPRGGSRRHHHHNRSLQQQQQGQKQLRNQSQQQQSQLQKQRLELEQQQRLDAVGSFDKRLAESDAYLQLLIEQERQLTSRVRGLTDADSTERDRANQIVDSLRQVIELIKQVIVALQMSKQDLISPLYSGAHQLAVPSGLVPPSDALIEGESIFYDHHATSVSDSSVTAAGAAAATATSPMQAASAANLVDFASRQVAAAAAAAAAAGGATSVVTSDAQPQRRSSDSGATSSSAAAVAAAAAAAAASNALIPATSFSSDEDDGDDDEFYDAEEGAAAAAADGSNSAGSGSVFVPEVIGSDDDCNYDELYDDMNESNLGNLDDGEHGSVIGHLISQVRIGMDLTKIVLPTFILERRSTLEMYADFLAHPDLWSDIPNHSHPRDRMIACLKWYLSAFHAGRRSAVAKKPYNPILGEIFQCYWDTASAKRQQKRRQQQQQQQQQNSQEQQAEEQQQQSNGAAASAASNGPVPWAPPDSVTFLAEQVSHHPPISAFYAECASQRVMLDGYIWTKSKFLGLSIAVQMVGQAVISLLDYDEEYIVTFPSGYGRSILTVPWIELVGKCRIECPRTGYSASVDFLAKPFYGGKKDKVLSQVFAPGEKKPFLTVEGLWNGQMYSRWTSSGLDASSTPPNSSASPQPPAPPHPPLEQQQVFIDTQHMPVIKKRVRPRAEQAPNESRRLWEGVTRSLKTGDIPSATEFKSRLEQEQRDAAKARLERGERWRQRHFREVGEHWVYHSPLSRRLSVSAGNL